jgi:hypothetical protein
LTAARSARQPDPRAASVHACRLGRAKLGRLSQRIRRTPQDRISAKRHSHSMRSQVREAALPSKPEPTSLASEPLGRLLQRLGSSASVPSGGAASAVAGALAASLVAMVSELSVGRPRYESFLPTIESARAEGHRLAGAMTSLADADAAAFAGYRAASSMPRGTEAEIAARRARSWPRAWRSPPPASAWPGAATSASRATWWSPRASWRAPPTAALRTCL